MKYLSILTICLLSTSVFAQKRALTHDDYDGWKSISGYQSTDEGDYTAIATEPQRGDGFVELIRNRNGKTVRLERASNPVFTGDGRWLFVKVSPPYEEVRQLKLKDTDKDDMPKNHLVRVNVRTGETDTIYNVISFAVQREYYANIAVLLEDEPEVEEEESDSTAQEEVVEEDFLLDGEEKKGEGYFSKNAHRLMVWNIYTEAKDTVDRVTSYRWADEVNVLVGIQSAGDSTESARLFVCDPSYFKAEPELAYQTLDEGFEDVANFDIDRLGTRVAWLRTADSAEADVQFYSLHSSLVHGSPSELISTEDAVLKEGWMLSPYSSVSFSYDSKAIHFGTMPVPYVPEEDTTVLDEEKVSLDIWSWTDEEIQPMQRINADYEKKQSYSALLHLNNDVLGDYSQFVQLEDEELESVSYSSRYTSQYVVGHQVPHAERASMSWNYPTLRDIYLVDVHTGERTLVKSGTRSRASLSPGEKYVYWWEGDAKRWMAYRIEDGQTLVLSANIPVALYDEDHDTPNDPSSYGMAGWTTNDEFVVLYDRYDMWKVEPGAEAVNLTAGRGREQGAQLRYVDLDKDNPFLSEGDWILHRFNKSDKSTAYVEFQWSKGEFETLIGGDFALSGLAKADSANVFFFRKETISEYPELYYVKGDDLADGKALTNTNPQQEDINWASVELVEWTTPRGYELQGLLIKPENFDPNKKYPVLVYFYETYSDYLHRYWSPRPSASTINFPYFASNEYIIFVPDIVYEEGYPGRSAEDCIISGAEMVANYPFVDASKMAIQGQSWGGYQVAHLVTRTDMFACAMAGAPVSNMTSAYGGIRWGSGMSREFQYERTQSRIGGTLWERRDLYLENSPVFYADQVETPLLIMHNDGDGAVPWYQGIEYFMALRRLQKPVWMLVYNNEEHNLMKRHNRMDLSVRMQQFFDFYLKGADAPEWLVQGRPYLEKDYNPATQIINEDN